MKKLIIFTVFTLLCFSCSSDDHNNNKTDNGGTIPADEKLLESFSFENESMAIEFEYNENKTIKRLNLANIYLLDFKYSGETITTINAIAGGASAVFEFTYDAGGRMNGFTVNGEERIVEYNPATNSYLFYEPDDEDRTTVFFNDFGDMERYKFYDHYDDKETNYLYVYSEDADKKGPMANTNKIHLYLSIIIPDLYFFTPFLASKPIEIVSFSGGTFQCSNSYYDDGFVEKSNIVVANPNEENPPSAGIYKYTKLEP